MTRKKPIEILTDQDVEALLALASRRSPSGIRNRALVATLYYAGLRVAELLALLPKDVDLGRGELTVRRGKGAKQRLAILSEPGRAPLELWLRTRAEVGLSGREPLFCTVSAGGNVLARRPMAPGAALTQPYVWTLLRRLADRAGIERRVHPHGLRHSHAVRLSRRGVPVADIQGQLGHASLATTSGYLDSVSAVDRARVIRGAG